MAPPGDHLRVNCEGDIGAACRYRDIFGREDIVSLVDPTKPNSKVPIDFGTELYEWLKDRSSHQRRPMAVLVREAVREYRERVDPQLRLPINGQGK